uniref:HDC13007 n=1 Tax=Drosophila melanogaster TaxID=7227 RepID=Q6IKA7_DROME|nr:TPA_inf: HDC13007 [Drosophila melanogaster]
MAAMFELLLLLLLPLTARTCPGPGGIPAGVIHPSPISTFHALRVSCLRKRGKETGRRSWLGRTGLIIIVAGDNRKMGGKDSCHVDET